MVNEEEYEKYYKLQELIDHLSQAREYISLLGESDVLDTLIEEAEDALADEDRRIDELEARENAYHNARYGKECAL